MIFIFIASSRPVSDKFAVHLPRQFLSSWDVGAFQQDKLVVCSMERVAVCTPAVGECVHLSEYHDVLRMA